MNSAVKHLVPRWVIRRALPVFLRREASRRGLVLRLTSEHIDVSKGSTVVRLSVGHAIYLRDIITSFEYYASAVVPFTIRGRNIVDYSTPRYHDVVGFDRFPILFPSLAEPLVTTMQYVDFARLANGMTVLDLGAYSGLTSIIFSQAVGAAGTVVAVDADETNLSCIKRNFANYARHSAITIQLLEGAVWNTDDGLSFSSEGSMGSSAASIVGRNRGAVRTVASFTLSTIARRFNLARVDFIKCDVEGAERVIFGDDAFFQRFSPRIVIEPHVLDGVETSGACTEQLRRYGYECHKIAQHGVSLPLLLCSRPGTERS